MGRGRQIGYEQSEETKRKISRTLKGFKHTDKSKQRMSEAAKNCSEETRKKRSDIKKEWHETHEHPFSGKKHTEETKKKMSEEQNGANNPNWKGGKLNYICPVCGREFESYYKNVKCCSVRCLAIFQSGERSPAWKGGISFEPYCPAFNDEKKEEIRNRDNRVCQLCGKSEILNGQRLSVHHIDGDKMQGCNGKKWCLASLCVSCNSKKDTIEKEFLLISNMN